MDTPDELRQAVAVELYVRFGGKGRSTWPEATNQEAWLEEADAVLAVPAIAAMARDAALLAEVRGIVGKYPTCGGCGMSYKEHTQAIASGVAGLLREDA